MTDTNSYREKGRAVFLAAMMVLSVVAGSAALVGTAAANHSPDDSETNLNDTPRLYQGQTGVVSLSDRGRI